MEVHLSEDLEKLVQEKVESGRYRSAGDVVRRALLVLDERDQELDRHATASMAQAKAADAWEVSSALATLSPPAIRKSQAH